MQWFERIFGFKESKEGIKNNISIKGNKLFSLANNKEFKMGTLEVISLKELKEKLELKTYNQSKIKISEFYGNVIDFHQKPENKNALFQVASQFNLLEMYRPENTPEMGITIYQYDRTQGPACAMTCAAGTLYRNYFTNINTLDNIEKLFTKKYWEFKNGYTIFDENEIDTFEKEVLEKKEEILNNLKLGIQWDTEVIGTNHCVSQIYCSAVPVSYNDIKAEELDSFSKIILEAVYEATFIAGILNETSNIIYLTLIGGSSFGNNKDWIMSAIEKNIEKYKDFDLDLRFITYSFIPDREIQRIIKIFK
jgi:ribosomal protein L33